MALVWNNGTAHTKFNFTECYIHLQENYKEMHENDKTPNSGLWVPLERESMLEIMQDISTVFAMFYFFSWVTVSWQCHIICYVGSFLHVRKFHNEEKRTSATACNTGLLISS